MTRMLDGSGAPSIARRRSSAPTSPRSANHEGCTSPREIAWDEWVAEDRAAEQLHTSIATLRRMRSWAKLPFTRLAGHVYYHPDDLAIVLATGYGRTA